MRRFVVRQISRRWIALLTLSVANLAAADAQPGPAPTPPPAVEKTPPAADAAPAAVPKIPPAVAAIQPSDTVLTLTLDNYNQIVAILREKDAHCLTLETAEGLMKLRIEKVLNIAPGGTLTVTQGSGAATPAATPAAGGGNNTPLAGPAAGPATGGNGAAAPNVPLSQMTPDERIKAAKAKLKAAGKAETTYQQAIQNHVGGVPQGVSPSLYNQLQRSNQNAPQNTAGNNRNWQPFSSDNPRQSNTNNQNPYATQQNQQYLQQQQQMYQNYLGYNNQPGVNGGVVPYYQSGTIYPNR